MFILAWGVPSNQTHSLAECLPTSHSHLRSPFQPAPPPSPSVLEKGGAGASGSDWSGQSLPICGGPVTSLMRRMCGARVEGVSSFRALLAFWSAWHSGGGTKGPPLAQRSSGLVSKCSPPCLALRVPDRAALRDPRMQLALGPAWHSGGGTEGPPLAQRSFGLVSKLSPMSGPQVS